MLAARRIYPIVLFVLFLLIPFPVDDIQAGEPQAFLPKSVFDFGTAVEGSRFTHEFILRNKGDAQLAILELVAICGCTGATSTKQIPPGGEGRIGDGRAI
jgi:hypothetical protein